MDRGVLEMYPRMFRNMCAGNVGLVGEGGFTRRRDVANMWPRGKEGGLGVLGEGRRVVPNHPMIRSEPIKTTFGTYPHHVPKHPSIRSERGVDTFRSGG